jgi:hypothetical protein
VSAAQAAYLPSLLDPDLEILASRLLSLSSPSIFEKDMVDIFSDLRDLVIHTELWRRGNVQGMRYEEFGDDQRVNIEHKLLSLPFECHQWMGDNSIQGCCRLAALLFINTVLWLGKNPALLLFIEVKSNTTIAWKPASAVLRSLVIALKRSLEGMELQAVWEPHSDMLVWILFLGANSALGQVERPWFVSQLAREVISLDLKCWENARALLLKIFYLDRVQQDGFQVVWAEVQRVVQAVS